MANKPWHTDPVYRRISRAMRVAANADPGYRCPTCGLTLAERQRTHPHAAWDCDHITPGRIDGGLRIRCSICNRVDGARMTNARRASGYGW